jgi:hypothetical protein
MLRDVEKQNRQNYDEGNTPIADDIESDADKVRNDGYLTTIEAARHMRHSRSWLLKQKDIPYYRGKPNLYLKRDLDSWLNNSRRYEPLDMRRRS